MQTEPVVITIPNDLREHLNLSNEAESGVTDSYLRQKILAAEVAIGNFIGRSLGEFYDDADYANTVPAPLREAVLQLAAHMFEQREAVLIAGGGIQAQVVPWGVVDLVTPYRSWVF